mgnify:CR=1 FL=1
MPEYEADHPDDSDSDVSACSLDSEFGVPIKRSPEVKKALTSANEKLRRSSRAKNPVTRYTYNEYMAHHYAFTMKVAAEQESKSPRFHHRLEGEESNYHGKAQLHKAAERTKKAELSRKGLRKPTKPKKAKPDVGRLTLELEGVC